MSQPYVGEIRLFAGNFAPAGWAFCNGQLLAISENDVLFNLIGTTYGGDGQTNFALPNLQGRLPVHVGTGTDGIPYIQGESGGVEQVTLTTQQIPVHNHSFVAAATGGDQISPASNMLANSFNVTPYINDVPNANLSPTAIANVGGSQPHDNMQPYLCISFIISLFGIFPTQN